MNSKNKIAETKAKTESEWYQVAENDFGMMFADPRSNSRYENLIGYFRGDFGKDGTSFYQTWFSVHPNDIYGDLQMTDYPLQKVFPMLESFRKMCDFCSGNPKLRFPPSFASDNFRICYRRRQPDLLCQTVTAHWRLSFLCFLL